MFKSAFRKLASACFAFLILAVVPARAGVIFSLSTNIGSGQISFNSSTGTDTSGVDSFFFATSSPAVQTYNLSDIATIDWTIVGMSSLNIKLLTSSKPLGGGPSVTQLFLTTTVGTASGQTQPPCGVASLIDQGSWHCVADPGSVTSEHDVNRPLTAALVEVSEPSTMTTVLLGLAGLGFARRRRQNKAAA